MTRPALTVGLLLGLLCHPAALPATPPTIRLITDTPSRALSLPLTAPVTPRSPAAQALCGTLWERVATRHGLTPALLYAVALAETRHGAGRATSRPWPYSLRGPAGPQVHRTRAAATQALRELRARHPAWTIDVGLMQINLRWHGARVAQPEQLLDPATNLELAAQVLAHALRSAPDDPELGIGRYHHWRDSQRARAYGQRVRQMAQALAGEAVDTPADRVTTCPPSPGD